MLNIVLTSRPTLAQERYPGNISTRLCLNGFPVSTPKVTARATMSLLRPRSRSNSRTSGMINGFHQGWSSLANEALFSFLKASMDVMYSFRISDLQVSFKFKFISTFQFLKPPGLMIRIVDGK
jgi:hypothetical protein